MPDKEDSIVHIVKGSGIVFLGIIIGNLLTFLTRILIGRFFTQADYGVYSLGFTLLSIFTLFSVMGFDEGLPRQIAFCMGKGKTDRVKKSIYTSIKISFIFSVLLSLFLFFASDLISIKAFNNPSLALPFKIISLSIFFSGMIKIFLSVFRGFNQFKPRAYFENIGRNVIFVLLLSIIISTKTPFLSVFFAFSFSFLLTFLIFLIYFFRKIPISVKLKDFISSPVEKELIFFSLPLLGVNVFMAIKSWTDTIMLGIYENVASIGVYNAALTIAMLLPIFVHSICFVFTPLVSNLYGKGNIKKIKEIYMTVTKWSFLTTVPFISFIFLFPEKILVLFFGFGYETASTALCVLSLGFFIGPVIGPAFNTLIAFGKNRTLLGIFVLSSFFNIILNVSLIPLWGINGAAAATLISILIADSLVLWNFFKVMKLIPFSKNYIKSFFSVLVVYFIFYIAFSCFVEIPVWMLPFVLIAFIFTFCLFLVITKSFDREDLRVILLMERKTGLRLNFIRRLFKFLS